MAVGLFLLLLVKGTNTFWPRRIETFEIKKGDSTEKFYGFVVGTSERKDDTQVVHEEVKIFRANKDVYKDAFFYVDTAAIVSRDSSAKVALIQRLSDGPAMGEPLSLVSKDGRTGASDEYFISKLRETIEQNKRQRSAIEKIEKHQIGKISAAQEKLGYASKAGRISPQEAATKRAQLDAEFLRLKAKADELRQEMSGNALIYRLANGSERSIPVSELLDVYAANQHGFLGRLGEAVRRGWLFLVEDPREANTEGGVFPAIFGTVAMTLVMSFFVTPFGVMAAIYLREYAKPGLMVRIVRICMNNLAGVPSIVFGVFGLAFFIYFVGSAVDESFFGEKLPTPTFGTPGILWASLTLALLTLPVVVVATEEALSAVPRGVREAALACGASKWQTIQRVVLPASLPGILTGVILAMARGAGEVAPLMLVGVVKLAPSLPIDTTAPFIHAERKFMHLGFHIYDLGFQSPDADAAMPFVYATALLLIMVVISLNLAAILIRNRLKKRFAVSSF